MVQHFSIALLLLTSLWGMGCDRTAKSPSGVDSAVVPNPAAEYAGVLEVVHNTQIVGWACDKKQPDKSVRVTIFDGSNILIDDVIAERERKDLIDAKIGNGNHGFAVSTRGLGNLKDGQKHEIHAFVKGTKFELRNSPKTYQFESKKPSS